MRHGLWTGLLAAAALAGIGSAQDEVIPHHQDRPPGPALSPAEAMAKMQLVPGFAVELFAAEPDLVNPVAMAFDERGRVWITESLEYPRREPGPGRDRIKILEDTNRDGKADKVTIFADGLNIPSGIALGYGGVFVANAPDILFLRDTDGDGRADVREVLLTGFGRTDTHELPNCLIWGPDGWLYGLNGVFNHCVVNHKGKRFEFTCALWRYHPRTKDFELFCEGTSNPWGLDYDGEGNFFVSACVIDHLWHLTETGYYHRQAGPYPPFTWKIESIVDHLHQKAAYCGLVYYDADAYPAEHRGRLFMGNIHGNCINVDALERRGASYRGTGRPDFLTANDAWFMPVVQKVGPDGCLWILDWYDRYHCYQDANRDPRGIDRLKGRLYRVTYRGTPTPPAFDLRKRNDSELVDLLGHPNVYYRRWARQLLIERPAAAAELARLVLDTKAPRTARLEAFWTLVSRSELPVELHQRVLGDSDAAFRAWGVRAAAAQSRLDARIHERVLALCHDRSADVRLQVAIAARRLAGTGGLAVLLDTLVAGEDSSELVPRIVWRHLEPALFGQNAELAAWLKARSEPLYPAVEEIVARSFERLLASASHADAAFDLVAAVNERPEVRPGLVARCLETFLDRALTGEVPPALVARFRGRFGQIWTGGNSGSDPRTVPALALAALGGNTTAVEEARQIVLDANAERAGRQRLFRALLAADSGAARAVAAELLSPKRSDPDSVLTDVLVALGRGAGPGVAQTVVAAYPQLRPSVRPQALDLLTSRKGWSAALLAAIRAKIIVAAEVNANQIRKMLAFNDPELTRQVHALWGQVRAERNPNREELIAKMRATLAGGQATPAVGAKVFERVCAQCHKLNGVGNEVGPDLTGVGRTNLDQLLSNLLDPNLVIGRDYQATVVALDDGQLVTGLLVEDSAARLVLKVAGGKLEIFPRERIEQARRSEVSLMPEDLEKQVTEQEFRDLIAYLRSAP